jgi:hypothetical protein
MTPNKTDAPAHKPSSMYTPCSCVARFMAERHTPPPNYGQLPPVLNFRRLHFRRLWYPVKTSYSSPFHIPLRQHGFGRRLWVRYRNRNGNRGKLIVDASRLFLDLGKGGKPLHGGSNSPRVTLLNQDVEIRYPELKISVHGHWISSLRIAGMAIERVVKTRGD